MDYNIFRGVQKPIVLKGLKGRYIYWGVTLVVFVGIVGIILLTTMSMLIGIAFISITFSGGLFFINWRQNKGLYKKNLFNGLCIIPKQIKIKNIKSNGKD